MIANSGRFTHSLPALLGDAPFASFLALSDWLYATTGQTHQFALPRLFRLLHQFDPDPVLTRALENDFSGSGIKSRFASVVLGGEQKSKPGRSAAQRQQRHLQ